MALGAVLAITLIIPQDSFVQEVPGTIIEFTMVRVPDGEIEIDGKQHEVKGLWFGETEVTWDTFDVWAFRMDLTPEQNAVDFDAESRPSRPYGAPDRGYGHQGYAALSMTHNSAKLFCKWLSKKTGRTYRLPTEAEWEYAARAGAMGEAQNLGKQAWYSENAADKAHPVKSKKPNAWGLYDMLGNIAEWCDPSIGEEPMVRGGDFTKMAAGVGFGAREGYSPAWQQRDAQIPKSEWWLSDGIFVGMRVVCEGPSLRQ